MAVRFFTPKTVQKIFVVHTQNSSRKVHFIFTSIIGQSIKNVNQYRMISSKTFKILLINTFESIFEIAIQWHALLAKQR